MSDKRFFIADDGGIDWSIVAIDREHAISLLRVQGAVWGVGECGFEVGVDRALALNAVEIREMTADEVARKTKCHTEDERGVIPLADARIGDLFCSEW